MSRERLETILKEVAAGSRSIDEALRDLRDLPFEDLLKLLYCSDRDVANAARIEIDGDRRWGWTILNEISRSLFFLPEPHVLVGAAALLHELALRGGGPAGRADLARRRAGPRGRRRRPRPAR